MTLTLRSRKQKNQQQYDDVTARNHNNGDIFFLLSCRRQTFFQTNSEISTQPITGVVTSLLVNCDTIVELSTETTAACQAGHLWKLDWQ